MQRLILSRDLNISLANMNTSSMYESLVLSLHQDGFNT